MEPRDYWNNTIRAIENQHELLEKIENIATKNKYTIISSIIFIPLLFISLVYLSVKDLTYMNQELLIMSMASFIFFLSNIAIINRTTYQLKQQYNTLDTEQNLNDNLEDKNCQRNIFLYLIDKVNVFNSEFLTINHINRLKLAFLDKNYIEVKYLLTGYDTMIKKLDQEHNLLKDYDKSLDLPEIKNNSEIYSLESLL